MTYVGAGTGISGGLPRAGVELHAFDFAAGTWALVGSHAASDADPALARTIVATLPAPVERFVRDGRLWLMAASRDPSPVPPAPGESRVSTDLVEVRASYLLP